MIVLATDDGVLIRLMLADRAREPDTAWLLFGPSDPAVVVAPPAPAPMLLAAE